MPVVSNGYVEVIIWHDKIQARQKDVGRVSAEASCDVPNLEECSVAAYLRDTKYCFCTVGVRGTEKRRSTNAIEALS